MAMFHISKSSFCNFWLFFHNDHLKTMVGFGALISFVISLLSLSTLLWQWSISKSCFFLPVTILSSPSTSLHISTSSTFDYSRIRITWRHWLDPRALITLLMSVFSLQSDKFNFCREDSSSWNGEESVISILPKEEQDTAFSIQYLYQVDYGLHHMADFFCLDLRQVLTDVQAEGGKWHENES